MSVDIVCVRVTLALALALHSTRATNQSEHSSEGDLQSAGLSDQSERRTRSADTKLTNHSSARRVAVVGTVTLESEACFSRGHQVYKNK